MYNGGYDGTRYSPLTQINTKNAGSLQEVARFKIPETLSFQCKVVVGDTMFITTLKRTYAIDARTGKQRWARTHELEKPRSLTAWKRGGVCRGAGIPQPS
jgi:glucose dehydrogenase